MRNTKPILFNTEMVRAIQNDTKTATRRVVKPQPTFFYKFGGRIADPDNPDNIAFLAMTEKNGEDTEEIYVPPYQPGDILYVRETWQYGFGGTYLYKASAGYDLFMTAEGELVSDIPWRPSIHMPREAARIFLRVTDVRVERLKEITETQAKNEGAEPAFEYNTPEGPVIVSDEDGYYILGFKGLWNSTIKPADRVLYGWEANPWVWVIEFERCERPKE